VGGVSGDIGIRAKTWSESRLLLAPMMLALPAAALIAQHSLVFVIDGKEFR